MKRRSIISCAALALCGCASTPTARQVTDDTPLQAGLAYALIEPRYQHGASMPYDLQIEVARIDGDLRLSRSFFTNIRNGQPALLALPPGLYYLSALNADGGYHRHELAGRESLFEVAPEQINYAGTWHLTMNIRDARVDGSLADGATASFKYTRSFSVSDRPGVGEELRQAYPNTFARLPVVYTWIDIKSDPRTQPKNPR